MDLKVSSIICIMDEIEVIKSNFKSNNIIHDSYPIAYGYIIWACR
jgi:hypothetical protein